LLVREGRSQEQRITHRKKEGNAQLAPSASFCDSE